MSNFGRFSSFLLCFCGFRRESQSASFCLHTTGYFITWLISIHLRRTRFQMLTDTLKLKFYSLEISLLMTYEMQYGIRAVGHIVCSNF